jgi:hypothetical protein
MVTRRTPELATPGHSRNIDHDAHDENTVCSLATVPPIRNADDFAELVESQPGVTDTERFVAAMHIVFGDITDGTAGVTATCPCGASLGWMRSDSRYCSNACRQRAYRRRVRAVTS